MAEELSFSGIDFLMLGLIVISALFGLRKGFFSELISLATWIVGVVGAILWGTVLGELLFSEFEMTIEWIPRAVGSGLILIVSLVIGAFIQGMFKEGVEEVGLGAVDRSLGFIFGAIRGCFILIAAGIIFDLQTAVPEVWERSTVLKFLMQFKPAVQDVIDLVTSFFESSFEKTK